MIPGKPSRPYGGILQEIMMPAIMQRLGFALVMVCPSQDAAASAAAEMSRPYRLSFR
jgi:hypothetical protein